MAAGSKAICNAISRLAGFASDEEVVLLTCSALSNVLERYADDYYDSKEEVFEIIDDYIGAERLGLINTMNDCDITDDFARIRVIVSEVI